MLLRKIDKSISPSKGVHNRIYYSKDGRSVLRISGKDDEAEQEQLKRGNRILMALKSFDFLGPLRLNLIHGITKRSNVGDYICKAFSEKFDTYWISEMEKVGDKTLRDDFPAGSKEVKLFAACMIWFLAVMKRELGFVHRELHLHNIMWREFARPKTVVINNELFFTNVRRVPVVIDYDFALTAEDTDPDVRGEFHGAPMVASVEDLFAAFDERDPEISYATDWHAVGHALVTCMWGGAQWSHFPSLSRVAADLYAAEVPDYLDRENFFVETAITTIPAISILNYYLGNGLVPPRDGHYQDYYDAFFSPRQQQILMDLINEGKVEWELPDPHIKYFLRHLFSWDPAQRTMYGEPQQYLHFSFFNSARFRPEHMEDVIALSYDFKNTSDTV